MQTSTLATDEIVIRAEGLRKSFGTFRALDGVDLAVKKGEILGLVGPDGAGKTTTMRLLCGILDADGGNASVLGIDVLKDPEAIKPNIGYMSQRFSLYGDLTVGENLTFFANLYHVPSADKKRREEQLLHASRMTPFRDRLASHLSGGMKQKLALACTLIHAPRILFLDEPTTGVDPVSRRDFWEILYSLLKDGATLFVSTPYMDEAERCSRIAFMDKGKVLVCDTPEALKNNLSGDLLELSVDAQKAAAKTLRDLPWVKGIQVFGDRLHIWVANADEDETRTTQHLQKSDIRISHLRRIQPGLEDVFISLTHDSAQPALPEAKA